MSYFKDIYLSSKSEINIDENIIELVKKKKPESVKELIYSLNQDLKLDEKVLLEHVLRLEAKGLIKVEKRSLHSMPASFYLKSFDAFWYWLTIATGITTVVAVLTISQNFYPWAYLRNFLGAIFIFFLPGYSVVKAIFPFESAVSRTSKEIETILRIGLSIGLSIALVSIVGLFLYYSPWGLQLTAIVLSIFTITVIFATAAVARNFIVSNRVYCE